MKIITSFELSGSAILDNNKLERINHLLLIEVELLVLQQMYYL